MTKQKLPATFKVDNFLIQQSPKIFATQRRGGAIQLPLPGFPAPLTMFDQWATWALYSLLDPEDPTAPVIVKPTTLLSSLAFAREYSKGLGYETYTSESYDLVKESLMRLYSYEIRLEGFYDIRMGKVGRPRRMRLEYRGRIVSSFTYLNKEGKDPLLQPASRRKNVNPLKTDNRGEKAQEVYQIKGEKPIAIRYTLAPDLVRGITGKGPNIGATIMQAEVLKFRVTKIGDNPIATRLLAQVLRQTAKTIPRRNLDDLAALLSLGRDHPGRNRQALLTDFDLLKQYGVIEDFMAEGEGSDTTVTFTKADAWHFDRVKGKEEPLVLPDPGDRKAKRA